MVTKFRSTPAFAEDGTTEIGTFSIDPVTGQVTFTPTDKSYTGKVTPAKVQAESSNGIKVDTTYTRNRSSNPQQQHQQKL